MDLVSIPMTVQVQREYLVWRNGEFLRMMLEIRDKMFELRGLNPYIKKMHKVNGMPTAPVQLPTPVHSNFGDEKIEGILLYLDSPDGSRSFDYQKRRIRTCSFLLVTNPPSNEPQMFMRLFNNPSKASNDSKDNTQNGWDAFLLSLFGVRIGYCRIKKDSMGCGFRNNAKINTKYRDFLMYYSQRTRKKKVYLTSEEKAKEYAKSANPLQVYDWMVGGDLEKYFPFKVEPHEKFNKKLLKAKFEEYNSKRPVVDHRQAPL